MASHGVKKQVRLLEPASVLKQVTVLMLLRMEQSPEARRGGGVDIEWRMWNKNYLTFLPTYKIIITQVSYTEMAEKWPNLFGAFTSRQKITEFRKTSNKF